MGRMATEQGGAGGGFKPDFGIHNAICCQIVDFGTHDKEWQGKIRGTRNIVQFGFEFVDQKLNAENGEVYTPIWGMNLTNSLGERANLRHLLEGWRGNKFEKEELAGFDLSKLLGLSCQLVIQPNQKGNPKITAITRAPAKFQGMRELREFWVEEGCFDGELPEWMPDWMVEEIKKSHEYVKGFGDDDTQPAPVTEFHAEDEEDDDIPF